MQTNLLWQQDDNGEWWCVEVVFTPIEIIPVDYPFKPFVGDDNAE